MSRIDAISTVVQAIFADSGWEPTGNPDEEWAGLCSGWAVIWRGPGQKQGIVEAPGGKTVAVITQDAEDLDTVHLDCDGETRRVGLLYDRFIQ